MIKVTPDNIKAKIYDADKPAIIEIYSESCGACQRVKPIYEELESEHGDDYIFAQLSVDEHLDLAKEFEARSTPTFVFIKDGEVKGQKVGYMEKEELKGAIKEHLG